jgi:hypothetical protein
LRFQDNACSTTDLVSRHRRNLTRKWRLACEYISLFALAKQPGRHILGLKKELDAAGITPALDPEKIGATFYLLDLTEDGSNAIS